CSSRFARPVLVLGVCALAMTHGEADAKPRVALTGQAIFDEGQRVCSLKDWPQGSESKRPRFGYPGCRVDASDSAWRFLLPSQITLRSQFRDRAGVGWFWRGESLTPSQRQQSSRGFNVGLRLHWDLEARDRRYERSLTTRLQGIRLASRMAQQLTAIRRDYARARLAAIRTRRGTVECVSAQWQASAAIVRWRRIQGLISALRCMQPLVFSSGPLAPSFGSAQPQGAIRRAGRAHQR
ncbi:MAG TPA: hypothetical protein DCQ06_09060, partial [Myxococcales bacterium]|nr:hypothetical protein [Myxococcales bacterium]